MVLERAAGSTRVAVEAGKAGEASESGIMVGADAKRPAESKSGLWVGMSCRIGVCRVGICCIGGCSVDPFPRITMPYS